MTLDAGAPPTAPSNVEISQAIRTLARAAQQTPDSRVREYVERQRQLLDALDVSPRFAGSTSVGGLRVTLDVAQAPAARGTAGTAVTMTPEVRVMIDGRPQPGVPVHFVVTEGGGSVQQSEQTTQPGSMTAAPGAWILGTPGVNKLVAYAGPVHEFSVVAEAAGDSSGAYQQGGRRPGAGSSSRQEQRAPDNTK